MSVDLEAGARERLARRRDRADAHDLGRAAGDRDAADPRQHVEPVLLGEVLGVTSTAAAPSVSGEEVPAVTVPCSSKAGFRPASASSLVSGRMQPSCSIVLAVAADRHDLVGEPPGGLGRGRLAVALDGELLLVVARDLIARARFSAVSPMLM